MKSEREKQIDQAVDSLNGIEMSPNSAQWLRNQARYLKELTNIYADNPDIFGLHDDLRTKPELILDTVFRSADKLLEYQAAYDKALSEIADANSISFSSLDEIPTLLQDLSVAREREQIVGHFKSGGVIAIGLMGTGASGKGTIGKRTGMERVVNVTTRSRRPSEEHGKDYLYIREMVPEVRDTLDIDTGFNIISMDNGSPVYELGADGKPINYFDKYGPYLVAVHRPGRAVHGTPISQFKELYDSGSKAIFFEHGPVQVQEAGEKLPTFIKNAKVVPVCILPPQRGVLPLAFRIAVRTYGDPDHQDTNVGAGYKISDSYVESTIGLGQIEELEMTAKFVKGDKPLGIAYIVNDDLQEAVDTMKELVSTG